MKILMCDLEGTLTAHLPVPGAENPDDFSIRPNAKRFLVECDALFDKIFLNTAVGEQKTREVMWAIGFTSYDYWHWHDSSPRRKTAGYERFVNDTVVQIDDCPLGEEQEDFNRYGIHFIQIKFYDKGDYWKDDNELMTVLDQIRGILGNQ